MVVAGEVAQRHHGPVPSSIKGFASETPQMGFPMIKGTMLEVSIVRVIVFQGLYWGSPILGNYQIPKSCMENFAAQASPAFAVDGKYNDRWILRVSWGST